MTVFDYTHYARSGIDYDSAAIEYVYYNDKDHQLAIKFNGGDAIYVYDDVSKSTHGLFVSSNSLQNFWKKYISGSFNSTRYELSDISCARLREEETPVVVDASKATVETFAQEVASLSDIGENTPKRYGVKFAINGTGIVGECELRAANTNDALALFFEEAEEELDISNITVIAVTRYLNG